ncbi:hypothetical protein COCSUDRAFT_54287 [Coccomyxa subellipsoidea C-169]|uniref:P-loop containing nucleoside triphosphate hydrolase protein n=1 Tax=Coccomyxa subellipsoidea (strain C-169) TaxID=574566 RepID=I0YRC1_COCSC|nr:hypothetical protein COCSUDRAFT_54287 [Coccomyxa subellipsoidea C-169]EIE20940.1 hypothetical protein COCSUDRAFT_54287 [Coccomyxa subellipsoidea C-169]|eukprot:XP_005645484.1 hypothetical protein COCSUDRAFT_54287 [Coccomyxa subellipsoidea C-169]
MQGKQYLQMLDDKLAASGKARHSASKYDFVKVKVWVGENLAHYYVLSRFLISRMLTVTKIPQMKAVKIALEVKKHLVDNDFMDISQDHFEAILFNVMRARGFGDDYVERYKMVTKFFQQRRPLIVLICGVPCTGKSTLAQQLASRLNMPNVLQTDAIYELMRMSEDGPLQPTPLWDRDDLSPGGLVREFLRECRIVRKGLDGSLFKCISDGKSIIMEGMHLDPSLYLYEFARFGQAHLKSGSLYNSDSNSAGAQRPDPASIPLEEGSSPSNAATEADDEEELKPGPVFVPIVLCMDDVDHELLVREWHACHAGAARDGEASGGPEERARSTLERLRVLQSHMCSYEQRCVPVVKVELANFNETLDRLHDYLLLCIQMAMEQDEADAHP